MAYLVETSILARLANTSDVYYPVATHAVLTLHHQGESLRTSPQNLIEFRNCATRPANVNGLGLPPVEAETKTAFFESLFPLLLETPDIYPAWKALVQTLSIIGKQVHDARLVAVCHVYGITHVLTFNVQHFTRFAAFGPGLIVVDPHSV
jgi:predicted nucleic acid-binding protein